MARYIDAEETKKHWERDSNFRLIIPFEAIDNVKTEDVAPVIHAKWIILPGLALCECSRCGRRELHYDDSPNPCESYPYCHCGAKMDGDEQ